MAGPIGDFLADVAKQQLQYERQTRSTLVQRASLVITTSGTLVTLLLGAAALVTKSQCFTPPRQLLGEVTAAVVLFILAALVALAINWPWRQTVIDVDLLVSENHTDGWNDFDPATERNMHDQVVAALADCRKTNNALGWSS